MGSNEDFIVWNTISIPPIVPMLMVDQQHISYSTITVLYFNSSFASLTFRPLYFRCQMIPRH